MKYIINDYIFDTERLLFYKNNLSAQDISRIETKCECIEDFNEVSSYISRFDTNNMKTKNIYPYEGGICFTYKCQLRCNYCSYYSNEESKLTLKENDVRVFVRYLLKNVALLKLVNKRDKYLDLFISGGGEPTYDSDFFKRAVSAIEDECQKVGVNVHLHLTTNAVNGALVEFISEHFDSIMISFDGMPQIQNRNRPTANGKTSCEIVVPTIKQFCENSDKIKITIRSTLWQKDIPLLYSMADYLYTNFPQINSWSIMPMQTAGRGGENTTSDDFALTDDTDFTKHYFAIREYVAQKYNKYNITSPMLWNDFVRIYCGNLGNPSCWLMPGGKMTTCLDSYIFSAIIGEVIDGKVEIPETYKNPIAKKYTQKFYECRDCFVYPFCKGGCPLRFLYDSKSSDNSVKWECETRRNYWKYIFNKVLDGERCEGWCVKKDQNFTDYEVYHLIRD